MAESDRSRSPVPGRTELNLELLPHQYDKNCRSFLDGVDQCKRQFGTRSKCHGLSLDLSFDLSSICNSRDLIF